MKPSFTNWLRAQEHRDDHIGHLSVEINREADWPGRSIPDKDAGISQWRQHLRLVSQNPLVHQALEAAWQEYQALFGKNA